MANVASAVTDLFRESPGFQALPGSASLGELAYLLRDAPRFFHERFEKYGRVFKTRFVYPCVFVVGEQANKTVMITQRSDFWFGKGYEQTGVRWVFEGSIMLQDGDAHRRMRDLLAPAVTRLAVRESAERVLDIWSRGAERLRHEKTADAYRLVERNTFDAAANVLVGLDLGHETDEFRPLFERLIDGVMAALPYRIPYGRLDRALDARAELLRLLAPKVKRARERESAGLVGQLAHHRDPDGSLVPIDEISAHLLLLAWAGYDTTASAGSWAVWTLAQRPDLQARLREELVRLDPADVGSLEASKDYPWLDAFLLEVERMYPSALFFPRVTIREVEIEGHRIPEGTTLFYTPYMSHRDPRTFDDPDAFDPRRFLPEATGRRNTQSQLFGFGGGPRLCLGKSFAKLQLKLMCHALLTRYHLRVDPTCRPKIQGVPVHHPVDARVRFVPLEETPS